MNTTASAEDMSATANDLITVPGDLLPVLRQRLVVELGRHAAHLAEVADRPEPIDFEVDAACDRLESLIAAHRALTSDRPSYPAAAVSAAAEATIEDARYQIAESGLGVDQAELLVQRVRTCEALQAQTDRQAVTA
jgi:hypothetical protein